MEEEEDTEHPEVEEKRKRRETLLLDIQNTGLKILSSALTLVLNILTPLFIILVGFALEYLFPTPPGIVVEPNLGISLSGNGYPVTKFLQAIGVTRILTYLVSMLRLESSISESENRAEDPHPSNNPEED